MAMHNKLLLGHVNFTYRMPDWDIRPRLCGNMWQVCCYATVSLRQWDVYGWL